MIQKTILCLIIITILSPFTRDSQGTPVSKRSAQSRFNAAVSCENNLRESKKKQKYRKNWEECIRKFISLKNSVVTNESGLKEKSLFRAAGLYLGLYRYSGKRSDLLNAKELFSNVTTDYPDSELYQLSRTEINRIKEIAKKKNTPQPSAKPPSKKDNMDSSQPAQKIETIIIDPGHGGKDPGAIGKSGLTEKEVVLDIGLRLRDMIIRKMGKRVIMTRDTDLFIPLDERSRLANGSNGELFVSIHANSSPKKNTRGVEVYLLGAPSDKRALATAARENATSEEDANFLQTILKELAKDFTTEMSLEFAHLTMDSFSGILDKRYNMVKLGVKKAPFYVLMHTDMPSILAEVSFISNPYEEALLKKDNYRQQIAEALFEGIREYIENNRSQSPS